MPGRYFFLCGAVLAGMNAVPAHAETIQITINQLEYLPAEIEAKAGDTIEWLNQDILAHTATVRGHWDVMIAAKATARLILEEAGTVEYYCRFHPNMKGRIHVRPKGTAAN
jgi:plastocyanin